MYPETLLPIAAHIPHAGTTIPSAVLNQFSVNPDVLWREVTAVTDWYTAELFGMPGIAVSQTPINRVVVDLERHTDDDLEEKTAVGQGVIYSHNNMGERIRRPLSDRERQLLLDNYYRPWHLQLEMNIKQQLARWGHCLLLDCHSFPDEPFGHENDAGRSRPDICLGTGINTPLWLLDSCHSFLLDRGYKVEVNFPYVGCLAPNLFEGAPRVPAIMLEINRRLYLEPTPPNAYRPISTPTKSAGFQPVQNDIWGVMLRLTQEASQRLER
jgi:N-formylglutamate deformylase